MFKFIIKGLKSYRDLPLRITEFGSCHRYEASGTMHGLQELEDLLKMMATYFALNLKLNQRQPYS